MKKLAYSLLALAFCLMLAASSVSARETISIKDDLGRDVTISSPSERVVFTMENALKTYYAVGDPKNVAALKDDKWMRKLTEDIFPVVDPEFEKKIVVNITGDQINLESLAKCQSRPGRSLGLFSRGPQSTGHQRDSESAHVRHLCYLSGGCLSSGRYHGRDLRQ